MKRRAWPRRVQPLRALAVCAALFVLAPCTESLAQSGFAGSWTASPARVEATVTTWGEDCGVRPQSYTAAVSPAVEVRDQGAHLALAYPDRTLLTNRCWSPNAAVTLTSATASDARWRMECRTPPGDARKETGHYTVTVKSRNVLELVEESAYDWRLKESHCVAKVRIFQRLERGRGGKRTGAPPEPDCLPGEITRMRLRPSEVRIEPGERVCFQARGLDAAGCARDFAEDVVTFQLDKPAAARAQLQGNCFRTAPSAADAEGQYRVVAQHGELRAEASVTVAIADLSDITARRSASAAPESSGPPSIGQGLAGAGVKAVAVDATKRAPMALLAAALSLVLLGTAGFVIARRRRTAPERPRDAGRREKSAAQPRADTPRVTTPAPARATIEATASPARGAQPPAPSGDQSLICPACRRGFAPGTRRCSADGTPVLPYSEYARQAREAETRASPCPTCGTPPGPGAVFCGECGTRLVS